MIYNSYSILGRFVGIVAGSLMLASCGDSETPEGGNPVSLMSYPPAAETQIELAEGEGDKGTWGDIIYGAADAPVEVIEYASLTCSHCGAFAKQVFPLVEENYIETGKVRFVFRNFLLNKFDLAASTISRCSNEEATKKLTKMVFAAQSQWMSAEKPQDELAALARKVGISRTAFDQCLSNIELQTHLVKMRDIGQKVYEVTGTPTLYVNGKKVDANDWDSLKKAIDDAL